MIVVNIDIVIHDRKFENKSITIPPQNFEPKGSYHKVAQINSKTCSIVCTFEKKSNCFGCELFKHHILYDNPKMHNNKGKCY